VQSRGGMFRVQGAGYRIQGGQGARQRGGVCRLQGKGGVCRLQGKGGVCRLQGKGGVCRVQGKGGVCRLQGKGGVCRVWPAVIRQCVGSGQL